MLFLLINLIIFGETYKLWCSALCSNWMELNFSFKISNAKIEHENLMSAENLTTDQNNYMLDKKYWCGSSAQQRYHSSCACLFQNKSKVFLCRIKVTVARKSASSLHYFCWILCRWKEWRACVPSSEGASTCCCCAWTVSVPAGRFSQFVVSCFWYTQANIHVEEGWAHLERGICNYKINPFAIKNQRLCVM